jgi:hypothetical protein
MIELHVPRKKWSPEEVKSFVVACRTQGGVPMFRTRYAGERFRGDGVMAICYAGPLMTTVFEDVPPEEIEKMEKMVGEWKLLAPELSSGLPPRGTGLILGTARQGEERGRGIPLTEEERRKRHESAFGSPL